MYFSSLAIGASIFGTISSHPILIIPLVVSFGLIVAAILYAIGKLEEILLEKTEQLNAPEWTPPSDPMKNEDQRACSETLIARPPNRTLVSSIVVGYLCLLAMRWIWGWHVEDTKSALLVLASLLLCCLFLAISIWAFVQFFSRFELTGSKLQRSSLLTFRRRRVDLSDLKTIKPVQNDLNIGVILMFENGTRFKLRGPINGYSTMLEAIALQNTEMADLIADVKKREEDPQNARTPRS